MTTWFISGHLDLTQEEFNDHYALMIVERACLGESFVVGDAKGCDVMAQRLLRALGAEVTVYHMLTTPRNNECYFHLVGGFASDDDRDAAMTKASDADIAWVRPGRDRSGTMRNLRRRKDLHRNDTQSCSATRNVGACSDGTQVDEGCDWKRLIRQVTNE